MFPLFARTTCLVALLGGAWSVPIQSVRACGPDFPNAYLMYSAEELAKLPTLSFSAELARLLPPGGKIPVFAQQSETPGQPTLAELEEIRTLLAQIVDRSDLEKLLARYTRLEPDNLLPQEFHLYAAGARAWHNDKTLEALNHWRTLLALPAEQRRYRTTWAAFMIGRALWATDPDAARTAFQTARSAVENGCTDVLSLATASLGWEARTHLVKQDYVPALRLYFRQHGAGDPSASVSLQLTLQRLFGEVATASDPVKLLAPLASDKQLRGIVTAWFVSRGGPSARWSFQSTQQFRHWLAALPQAADLDPVETDRWAWATYQNGLWPEAAAFARRAPADAPASEWVRAMLSLRDDDFDAAVQHLAGAAKAFPQDPGLQDEKYQDYARRYAFTLEELPLATLAGVRGTLALQRAQFVESLRLFLRAGHWADAAYVAERVLTLDELATFVRQEAPAYVTTQAVPAPDQDSTWHPYGDPSNALRHLLARRFVRANRFDEAKEFFPPEVQPVYERYVALVHDGYREENSHQTRGLALWQAAQIIHR